MNKKIKFIAEVSSNHNQSLKRCKKFIDIASKIGCYAIKFQLFKIDELFSKEVLKKYKTHRDRKKWELPVKYLPILSSYAKKKGLKFGCTPFYMDAVKILKPYVDFYKIASYELLWLDLFNECINTKKKLIFSTGMSTQKEVEKIFRLLKKKKFKNFSIMRCNSAYPTTYKNANLKSIESLKILTKKFFPNYNNEIGWSDHTCSPAIIYRAINKFDAKLIEFHLDLDEKGREFHNGHCWLPNEIEEVIKNVNIGLISDGNGNIIPSKSEKKEKNWRADPSDGLRPLKFIRKKII